MTTYLTTKNYCEAISDIAFTHVSMATEYFKNWLYLF